MSLLLLLSLLMPVSAAETPADATRVERAEADPLKKLAKDQRKRREAFRKKQKEELAAFEATLAGKSEEETSKLRAEHAARAKAERKAFHKRLKAERDALRGR